MSLKQTYLFAITANVAFALAANSQTNYINGVAYVPTSPMETIIVPPTGIQSAESTYQYSGYILVSGSGSWVYTVDGIARNDLLYYYNNNSTVGVNLDPMFFGTTPITSANKTPIEPYDDTYPPYNSSHSYTFIVDLQVSGPSNLYFGVGDSYYPDNTGSLSVQLTQLQPVPAAPVFTLQPRSQVVSPGQPVTFSASATGYPASSYQWLLNGTNISGATNTSYTISSTVLTDFGYYSMVASNSVNSSTSSPASLGLIQVKMLAAVYLTGPNGANYQLEATPVLGPTNLMPLTNVTITSQPYIYVDYSTPTNNNQFYSAIPQ